MNIKKTYAKEFDIKYKAWQNIAQKKHIDLADISILLSAEDHLFSALNKGSKYPQLQDALNLSTKNGINAAISWFLLEKNMLMTANKNIAKASKFTKDSPTEVYPGRKELLDEIINVLQKELNLLNELNNMENIKEYIHSVGALHDVKIMKFLWLPEIQRLELEVDDLEYGIKGFPGYTVPKPTRIVFSGVRKLEFNISETPWIYEWEFLEDKESKYMNRFGFAPGGKMIFGCDNIEFIKI